MYSVCRLFLVVFLLLISGCQARELTDTEIVSALNSVFTTTDGSSIGPGNSEAEETGRNLIEYLIETRDVDHFCTTNNTQISRVLMLAVLGNFIAHDHDPNSLARVQLDSSTWKLVREDSRSSNRIVTFQVLLVASFVSIARMLDYINRTSISGK